MNRCVFCSTVIEKYEYECFDCEIGSDEQEDFEW